MDTENRGSGRKPQHEKPLNGMGLFRSEEMSSVNYPDPHIMSFNIIGWERGALTPIIQWGAMNIRALFNNHAKTEWRIWDKSAVSFMKSDIQMNHRHVLSAKTLPGTLPWIKISSLYLWLSLSVSLCLSLSQTLSPSTYLSFTLSLECCSSRNTWGYPGWNIWSRRAVKVFIQPLPSIFWSSTQIKTGCPKNSSVGIDIYSNMGHPPLNLPIDSPVYWPTGNLKCTVVYVVPYLTHKSTHFQQCSYEALS